MAIAFVAANASTGNPTTDPSVVIPSATLPGHELVLLVCSRNHTSGTAYPVVTDNDTGGESWVLKGEVSTRQLTVWRKKATSGSASKTISISGCVNSSSAVVAAYSGAIGGDSLQDFLGELNATGDESSTGITPTFANSLVLVAVMSSDANVATGMACTDPATLGERINATSTGGSDCAVALWDGQQSGGPSATGTFNYSQDPNTPTRTVIFTMRTNPDRPPGSTRVTPNAATQVAFYQGDLFNKFALGFIPLTRGEPGHAGESLALPRITRHGGASVVTRLEYGKLNSRLTYLIGVREVSKLSDAGGAGDLPRVSKRLALGTMPSVIILQRIGMIAQRDVIRTPAGRVLGAEVPPAGVLMLMFRSPHW